MNLAEETALSNNLIMQVWDGSRAIASDTTKVELRVMINVEVREEYFSDPADFRQVVTVFGQEISYEYTKERTFVSTPDSKRVFNELLEDFRRDSLPYISRTDFPVRFAMSKLRDIRRHPYRYRDRGTTQVV
ncbi:MAG: hypothetical protein JRD43_02880 [Deltaproteobacteria bacterium]|nr:hypothetical protein [Deltaproteobacteria bacterium]MBW2596367.1 hypothetical protein [Deltaproteobacteria bacterium]MBW2650276.1 hypothetical protein [Deltaproteobacteria bacterium]